MKHRIILTSIVGIGLLCPVLTGCVSQSAETVLPEEPGYPVNSAGMTYGSMEDAQQTGSTPPVLVATVATNGTNGYMYYEDYASAVSANRDDQASSDAEQDRISKTAKAFRDEAFELFGCDLVSEEESVNAVLLSGTAEGDQEAVAMLSSAISSRVDGNTTTDGSPISSNPDESALSVVTANKARFCAECRPENLQEQTALDVLSQSIGPEQSSSGLFGEADFLYLSIVSQNAAKVPVDVFDVDGCTKVGQALVDPY